MNVGVFEKAEKRATTCAAFDCCCTQFPIMIITALCHLRLIAIRSCNAAENLFVSKCNFYVAINICMHMYYASVISKIIFNVLLLIIVINKSVYIYVL